jgi:hypothetical protein
MMKMSTKIIKAIRLRDSTDEVAIAIAVLQALRTPPNYLVEDIMRASVDQSLKVWRNTIDAILDELGGPHE